ncbi:MAG: Co2+/Mg2+ efflux protein ApaG [Bacteroidota bacterium]
MHAYVETTENVTISVSPMYLDGQSDPMTKKFAFAYFVRIENHGVENVQLLRRHWYIHDSNEVVKEVEGEGVVGQQPVIAPGKAHEYNSFCILGTFEGSMVGTYLMRWESGERFKANIPRFHLRASAN